MEIPQDLVNLLARAIRDAIWFKRNITRLFTSCGVPPKVHREAEAAVGGTTTMLVVPEVISQLNLLGGPGELPIRKLFHTMCNWKDFSSLDPSMKANATKSVVELRSAYDSYQAEIEFTQRKEREEWARKSQMEREERQAVKPLDLAKFQALRDQFDAIYALTDEQERGNRFQDLMNEVFKQYTTLSNGAFNRTGEQIDGLFYFDNHPYYVEVRWKKKKTNAADISVLRDRATAGFGGDTKALFISFEGFTPDALERLAGRNDERVVLMDGGDIHTVLEGRMGLDVLIMEKQMDLAKGVRAFVSVYEILTSRAARQSS